MPRSTDIPGKVFLLGEYAVLAGLPAILTTLEPRFGLTAVESEAEATVFHAESPAGKLVQYARNHGYQGPSFKFEDPYRGAGGFGGSSAQFALVYEAVAPSLGWGLNWKDVWERYRDICRDVKSKTAIPPSGADVVAQWQGGTILCNPRTGLCESIEWDGAGLLVFSAARQPGRKAATHDHLGELEKTGFPGKHFELLTKLELQIEFALSALRKKEVHALAQALENYGDALARFDLETQATHEDRVALRALPGVLGVKGTGALQADAVLVLFEGSAAAKSELLKLAQARGLELISDGKLAHAGVRTVD